MIRSIAILSFALGVVSVSALALPVACVTNATAQPCRNIPAGGCPLSNGVACDDPTCAAAYACNPDGTWSLDHPCTGFDAGPDTGLELYDAGRAPPVASIDASGFDAPPGTYGGLCSPPLQDGDCQLSTALGCPAASPDPCCGCEGLYLCLDDGTWQAWGYCDVDAGLVHAP